MEEGVGEGGRWKAADQRRLGGGGGATPPRTVAAPALFPPAGCGRGGRRRPPSAIPTVRGDALARASGRGATLVGGAQVEGNAQAPITSNGREEHNGHWLFFLPAALLGFSAVVSHSRGSHSGKAGGAHSSV